MRVDRLDMKHSNVQRTSLAVQTQTCMVSPAAPACDNVVMVHTCTIMQPAAWQLALPQVAVADLLLQYSSNLLAWHKQRRKRNKWVACAGLFEGLLSRHLTSF